MRYYILGILLCLFLQTTFVVGQEVGINKPSLSGITLAIDSLENQLKNSETHEKASIYLQIAYLYRNINKDRSAEYCRLAIKSGADNKKSEAISEAYRLLANFYKDNQVADSALYYLQLAIDRAAVESKAQQEAIAVSYQLDKQVKRQSNNKLELFSWVVLGMLVIFFLLLFMVVLRHFIANRFLRVKMNESESNMKLIKVQATEFKHRVELEVANQIEPINVQLTKARQRDLDLKKKLKQLEESDYLKNAFLGSMSHDIRTPLNGILGFSSLLQTELAVMGNAHLYEYSSNIEQSGIQLTNLLDNIIDISSIEANMVEVEWKLEVFSKIVKEVEENYVKRAKDKGLVFKVKIDPELPKLKVDGVKLTKVINLLVDNAVKFTETGFVTINTAYNHQKNIAVIQIKDTGPGIEPDILKALLASFQYGQQKKAQIYQGKGIGLTLAHRFVSLMGGDFFITSTPESGTTVTLAIPCDGKQPDTTDAAPGADFERATLAAAPQLGQISIFIVEDDRMNRMVLEKMLKATGKITMAEDGDDALTKIEQAHNQGTVFQVMLFDMQLPAPWDGITLMKTVKERIPEYKSVPFIVQTAFAMSGDKDHYITSGFDDYISKPISKTELFTIIQKQLLLKKG